MGPNWFIELLRGIGKLFLQPLFYYAIILAIAVGISRVKRERRHFRSSVYDFFHELRYLLTAGIGAGFCLSILTVVSGHTLPTVFFIILTISTILLSINGSFRFLSPAFTIGLAFVLLFAIDQFPFDIPWLQQYLETVDETYLTGITILLGVLLIVEGVLMQQNGSKEVAPKLRRSRRGLVVGAFQGKRIWFIPILCFLPTGSLTPPFEWWPVIDWGANSYSLLLFPFVVGFQQQVQTTLPAGAIKRLGSYVRLLGVLVTAIAIVSIWIPMLTFVTVGVAIIGRVWISYRHRMRENAVPYFFTPKNNGLMVLDVIPNSPAYKMGLETGEVIVKCNNKRVFNLDELYQALQSNLTYCKLEVLDVNGQVRMAQAALYEDDHHELGILYVGEKGQRKWTEESS